MKFLAAKYFLSFKSKPEVMIQNKTSNNFQRRPKKGEAQKKKDNAQRKLN